MIRNLFPLALQGTLRKKRSSALVFLVLLLSFSCALMSLSLTASISKTNEEYRYDVYGEWFLAIAEGLEGDAEWLQTQPWAESVGTAKLCAYVNVEDGVGTMDAAATELSHMKLLDGRLPEAEGEVALTKDALLAILRRVAKDEAGLRADDENYVAPTAEEIDRWTLGQSIPLKMSYSYQTAAGETVNTTATFHYTLVGVMENYCDMWSLEKNKTRVNFAKVLISEATMQALVNDIGEHIARNGGEGGLPVSTQFYIGVKSGQEDAAYEAAKAYMTETRGYFSDREPSRNGLAYPSLVETDDLRGYDSSYPFVFKDPDGNFHGFYTREEMEAFAMDWLAGNQSQAGQDSVSFFEKIGQALEKGLDRLTSSDRFYSLLIAVVALTAVLCVYMMQLPAEVHSFAVLRSIGVTKGQILALMGMESLLLVLPAVALGIPTGMLLTRLALRLLMYSDSVGIITVVPYASLGQLFLLWLAVIALSRLIIFGVTVRTPLTGRMQMEERKARRARHLRSGLIALLLVVFGTAAVYTAVNAAYNEYDVREIESRPAFVIQETNAYAYQTLIPAEWIERLETFPGVKSAEPYCDDMTVWLSYDGMEEIETGLWVIDPEYWGDSFAFGRDKEAFADGELVLLMARRENKESIVLPAGEIRLRAIYNNECTIDVTTAARVEWTEGSPGDRGMLSYTTTRYGMWDDYEVVCSPAFFEKFLNAMVEDGHWYYYTQGDAVGYEWLLVSVDMNLYEAMSTNRLLDNFCDDYSTRNRVVSVAGHQSNFQQRLQLLKQELILLYSCGVCALVVTLLLMSSALALETEQERRSFTILRVLGMSNRQMRRRVFGKALRRSLVAVLSGWVLFGAKETVRYVKTGRFDGAAASAAALWKSWKSVNVDEMLPWLSLACLAAVLLVSFLSKRGLRRDTELK